MYIPLPPKKIQASKFWKKGTIFFVIPTVVLRFVTAKFYITEWNDKIVVLKKKTLQIYFKTFIKKINSGNLIMY